MKCFNCGNNLPDDSTFCQYCGADLAQGHYCSNCGAIMQEEMNFCPKCGHQAHGSQEEEPSLLVDPMETEPEVFAPVPDEEASSEMTSTDCTSNPQPVQTQEREPAISCTATTVEEKPFSGQEDLPKKKKKPWVPLVIVGAIVVAVIGFFAIRGGNDQTMTPAKAAENVLYLEMYDASGACIGSGSGFLVNDNLTLVTNYHVIEGAYRMIAMTADDEYAVEVDTVLAYDETADLAVLKCSEKIDVVPLVLADSDQVKQGDVVYAAGYPLGIANTLSDGIVSSRYIDEYGVDLLQITAPISGGSSGGPLLNESGQVIGVVCAYYVDGQNMNIAIASNAVTALLQQTNSVLALEEFYLSSHSAYDSNSDIPAGCVAVRVISLEDDFTAEYILKKWESGEATEDSMIEIMDEYASEQGGGQLYIIEPGQFVDEIDDWCFDSSRRAGDVAIIENPYGFSICYFSGQAEDKEPICNHEYGKWSIAKEATCKEKGEKVRACSLCGEQQTERIPMVDHIEKVDAGIVATCTSEGKTKGSHCSVCGEVLIAQSIIPIAEHAYSNGSCTVCGRADPSYSPPKETAFSFLREWVSDNYNKVLTQSGVEDKAYQEIIMSDTGRDIYQVVYCEDIDRVCLRYTVSNNTGESSITTIWLEPYVTSFTASYFFYLTANASDASLTGSGEIYAPSFSENNAYSFTSFDGRPDLMESCQNMAKYMYLESLNFLDYIFYTYALPEGHYFSTADFGFNL